MVVAIFVIMSVVQREPGSLARELSQDSEALDSLLEKQRLMNQS